MPDNTEKKEMESLDFESAYKKLVRCAEELNDPNVSLNDAIASYKSGMEYYKICSDILEEAKQLIQVYDRQNDIVREESNDVQ